MLKKMIFGILIILMTNSIVIPKASYAQEEALLNIGVLSFENKEETLDKWGPLGAYLSEFIEGYEFQILPLYYEEMDRAVEEGALDFIFTNPGHYVELKTNHGLSGAIATLMDQEEGEIRSDFGGVIFTRKEDGPSTLEGLRGKTLSAVSKNSLGGYQAAAFELYNQGVNPERDVDFLFTGMPHSNAVIAVIEGEADGGFVRTGVLETMASKGLVNLEELEILNPQNPPGFSDLLSTALYPEWPFAAADHVQDSTSRAVAAALLMLPSQGEYAEAMGIYGFNIPSNYLVLEEMMRGLGLPPFEDSGRITSAQLWENYGYYILGIIFIILTLSFVVIYNSITKKRMEKINHRLKETMKALGESHQRFNYLFHNMHDGFALYEVVFDKEKNPVDYRFLEINKAFENITGLQEKNIINKTIKEVLPNIEDSWIDEYAYSTLHRTSRTFSKYSPALDKHFHVNVYSISENQFYTIFTDITKEVLEKEKTEKEKRLLEIILEDTLSGYWDWDMVQDTEYLSPSFKAMFGYEDHEMENTPRAWQGIIYREDLRKILQGLKRHVESKGEVPFYEEVRYQHKEGSTVWVICSGRVIEWEGEKPLRMVGCHMNITPQKSLEKQITEDRELFKTTLHSIGDAVISTDAFGRVDIMNDVAEGITGWSLEEAKGLPFEEIFPIVCGLTGNPCNNPVEMVLESGEVIELGDDTILINKEGKRIPVEDSAAPILDEKKNIKGVVVVFRDATEKREKQDRIKYLSYHDQLTGLYNRHFFDAEIKRLDVERNYPLALVMIDVNGLKLANDAFGHEAGDRLLKTVAKHLKKACREDDIIARTGGDEFVILLPNCTHEEVELFSHRITTALKGESIGQIVVSVSMGWGIKDHKGQSIREILSDAEDHMYRRKVTESQEMRNKSINHILQTLKDRNPREKNHMERVGEISRKLGEALELEGETLHKLELTAKMHDIGKIVIPNEVLNKSQVLTEDERREIKRHSEVGYQILKSTDTYTQIADYVLSHHERWDGKGYPRGLSGEEIPWISRILAVADAYEAMTADRPYKKALKKKEALEEIKKDGGAQFDPMVVEALEKIAI